MTDDRNRRSNVKISQRPIQHPDTPLVPTIDELMAGTRLHEPPEEWGEEIEVCVCNGRRVDMPDPNNAKRVAGWDKEDKIYRYTTLQIMYGPGSKIKLRESEATRLMALGFVCWPQNYTAPPQQPEVETVDVGLRRVERSP